MSTINKLLELTPENLANEQFSALQKHAVKRLTEIANLIKEGKVDKVYAYTFYSPAGDDHGLDNQCINFSEDTKQDMDIGDVLETLIRLKTISSGGKTK